ncbi:MAG: hydrogenase-4 component, partial [Acidobacteriota bacterium]|nr:hydrogenase-4 component [Acidobacteriota bacterium]
GRLRQPALPTWDCGFGTGASGAIGAPGAVSSSRLQYSASSFADLVTSRFAWALRPQERRPVIDRLFPVQAGFDSHVGDAVLELFVRPRVERLRQVAARIRAYQQGDLQKYVLYIVGAIVALLLFNLRLDWLAGQLFGR